MLPVATEVAVLPGVLSSAATMVVVAEDGARVEIAAFRMDWGIPKAFGMTVPTSEWC